MALTLFVCLAWLSVIIFACLPKKLPPVANVLFYFGLAIIDINKFTIMGYRLKLFEISRTVPGFLTAVVYRDIVFSLAMLIYMNVFWTAETKSTKIISTLCIFFFALSMALTLRSFDVFIFRNWGVPQEIALVLALILISLLLGRLFQMMAAKEVLSDGERGV